MEEPLEPPMESHASCEGDIVTRVSQMRWYCLMVCAGISAIQGGYWNNFGPIAEAVKPLFGWNNASIALLNNWGPIGYFLMVVPSTWLLDVKGIKLSCVIAAGLVFVGSLCRVVNTTGDDLSGYLMHLGQFLNNLGGPVAMMIGPVLSATWFPPSERTKATAVVSVLNYGGCAATFVVGPMIVHSRNMATAEQLRNYMIGQAVLATLLFVASVFVPSKPPFPPSRSAQVTREMMLAGLKDLRHRTPFWVLATCYASVTGFFAGWGSMLGPNIENVLPKAIAERDAGWMGFWGAIASCVAGVGLSALADGGWMSGRKKRLLVCCCVGATVFFTVFGCLCSGILSFGVYTIAALYATSITAAMFANATAPLFYEMSVEETYPVAEGLTTGILTLLNNIACFIFLVVQNVHGIGTAWMNWACAGACALPLILLVRLPENNRRLEFDTADAQSLVCNTTSSSES